MLRAMGNTTQLRSRKRCEFFGSAHFLAELRKFTDRQQYSDSIGSSAQINKECETGAGAYSAEAVEPVSTNASDIRKVKVGVETKTLDDVARLFLQLSTVALPFQSQHNGFPASSCGKLYPTAKSLAA